MPTRAESLIRSFCQTRRMEIEGDTRVALKKVPETVPIAHLSKGLQSKIARYTRVTKERNALKVTLERAGLNCYDLERRHSRISNPARTTEQTRISDRRNTRLATLERLQQAAFVAVLGRTQTEARIVVEELQKALRVV